MTARPRKFAARVGLACVVAALVAILGGAAAQAETTSGGAAEQIAPTPDQKPAQNTETVPAPSTQASPENAATTPAAETPKEAAAAGPPDERILRAMVRKQAEADGLPPEIAEAVADVESGFNVRAVGGVGEIGLMQILPSTARMLGFSEPLPKLFEPENNIRYGVRYLSDAWKITNNDICATVMKYRAGHGETRYSQKSVAYCVRVRALLTERGFKVTGTVPVATFGAPATGFGVARTGRVRIGQRLANGRVRVAFNWRPVDLKRRALDKAGGAGLRIAQ